MTRDTRTILGFAGAACVACCIGPILAVLGAIGLATVVGVAIFGVGAVVVALLAIPGYRIWRRRRRCKPDPTLVVRVAAPEVRGSH